MSRMLFVGGPMHGQTREWSGQPMHVQGPVDLSIVENHPQPNDVTFRATSKLCLYVCRTFLIGGVPVPAMVASHLPEPVEPWLVEALTRAGGLT